MPTATPAARPAVSPSTKASSATTASVVPPGVGVAGAPTAGRGQGALEGTAAVNVPDGVGPPNPAAAPCTGGGAGVGHEDEYTPDGWDGAADVARGAAANGADTGPGDDDDCGDGGAAGGAAGTGGADARGGETDNDGASGVGRATGVGRARGGGGAVRGGNGGGSALWGATVGLVGRRRRGETTALAHRELGGRALDLVELVVGGRRRRLEGGREHLVDGRGLRVGRVRELFARIGRAHRRPEPRVVTARVVRVERRGHVTRRRRAVLGVGLGFAEHHEASESSERARAWGHTRPHVGGRAPPPPSGAILRAGARKRNPP